MRSCPPFENKIGVGLFFEVRRRKGCKQVVVELSFLVVLGKLGCLPSGLSAPQA